MAIFQTQNIATRRIIWILKEDQKMFTAMDPLLATEVAQQPNF